MPVMHKGSFSINLGIVAVGGELSEADRQCAWELYCELVSRVALVGKQDARGELVFIGELYSDSLDSVHAFFREARALMRRYPVGRISGDDRRNHLGFFIAALLEVAIRPFLEKWQATYRHWWRRSTDSDPGRSPFERQQAFAHLDAMLADWRELRRFCRAAAKELTETFDLPDVMALEPPRAQQEWLAETGALVGARNG